MLGIGTPEMLIVGLVALIVFGPARLPELAGQVGRWVREFRRMTADLSEEFEKTVAEADDIKRSLTGEVTGMRSQVQSVTDSVKKDLAGTGASAKAGAKRPATGAGGKKPATATERADSIKKVGGSSTAAASKGKATAAKAMAAPVATKADPLADVSLMDDEPVGPSKGVPVERAGGSGAVRPAAAAANGGGAQAKPSRPAAAKTNGAATVEDEDEDEDEAIVRARRRRATAGYARRN